MGASASRVRDLDDAFVMVADAKAPTTSPAHSSIFSFIDHNQGEVPTLTEDILLGGLNSVAEALQQQRKSIRIITVGGAVNTLLLKSREATTDVDFFYSTIRNDVEITNLIRIAERVAWSTNGILEEQWLNNHTSSFIDGKIIKKLYDQSIKQNRVVFDSTSLKVYAAAWPFAFVQKVIRMGSVEKKSYDIDDAIAYAKEIGEHPAILYDKARAWAREYGLPEPRRDAIEEVIGKYRSEMDVEETG